MVGKIKIIAETIFEIEYPSSAYPNCNTIEDVVAQQQEWFNEGAAFIDDYTNEKTIIRVEKYGEPGKDI